MYGHAFVDGGVYRDEETHQLIDVEYLKQCFVECADLLQFIQRVESGLITISMTEYTQLPHVVNITWGIYKSKVNEKRDKEHKKMMAQYGR